MRAAVTTPTWTLMTNAYFARFGQKVMTWPYLISKVENLLLG